MIKLVKLTVMVLAVLSAATWLFAVALAPMLIQAVNDDWCVTTAPCSPAEDVCVGARRSLLYPLRYHIPVQTCEQVQQFRQLRVTAMQLCEVIALGSVMQFAIACVVLALLAMQKACCTQRDPRRRTPPRRRELEASLTPAPRPAIFDNGPSTIKRKLEDFFGPFRPHDVNHSDSRDHRDHRDSREHRDTRDHRDETPNDAFNDTFGRADRRQVTRRRAV